MYKPDTKIKNKTKRIKTKRIKPELFEKDSKKNITLKSSSKKQKKILNLKLLMNRKK